MTLDRLLPKLGNKENLSADEMASAMESIVNGSESTGTIEDFLRALRDKGETAVEIGSAAVVMRRYCVRLPHPFLDILDTCGTGGDVKNTLNVSTLAAIVACAAGARVAKHGNRSVSSVCGSADILELLGVKIDLSADQVTRCIDETGFGFLFAPHFHPSIKQAMPARKNLGGKTIFNLLGPLINPAGARYQLVGVYAERLLDPMAEAFSALGLKKALAVHGDDGMDEITLCAGTQVALLENGKISRMTIDPAQLGIKRVLLEELVCSTKDECLKAATDVLAGGRGPHLDIICLNAGAALWISEKTTSILDGFRKARETVLSGRAKAKLDQIAQLTQTMTA